METGTPLDYEATGRCLDNFLEKEGRISLLFLRNIQSMDFKVHGTEEARWSIHSEKRWTYSGWTYCTISKCMDEKPKVTFKDRWRVAIEDPDNLPSELQYRHKRTMKDVECGIAALVPDPKFEQTPIFKSDPIPRFFSTLPLTFSTNLPVHIHATFALASDRASIPIEDSMQEDGAKWNKWLLSSAIPQFYLHFLEDIGRETIELRDPFEFWPKDSPPQGYLSEPIFTSFWQTLPKSSCQLFPVTRQVKAAQLKKREPPKLVTVIEAVFDLLDERISMALREILESQIPTLVRAPMKIRSRLQTGMEVKSVTPKRLRELFREESASKCLENTALEDPTVLEILLGLISPSRDAEFTELDGCRILPLADRTLGTLRLATIHKQADCYLVANQEELELFHFALGRLVALKPGKHFKKAILDSAKFNVTRLDLFNLGTLLGRMDFGDRSATVKMDTWLNKFWDYCRRAEELQFNTKSVFTSSPDIRCRPIFRATRGGVSSYIEPERLDLLPAVIEPDKLQQRSLCAKFPGIYMFSFSCLPQYLRSAEICLDTCASFARFITTITKLAKQEGAGLDVYIRRYLGTAEIKVCLTLRARVRTLSDNFILQLLQKLVIKYVSADPSMKDNNIKISLRSLPVWPTTESSTWISATAGLATQSLGLLVPWITGYQSFIEPNFFISNLSTMRALGVCEVSGVDVLLRTLTNLPPNVPGITTYRSFIRAISDTPNWRNALPRLRQIGMAPNRTKLLVPACNLFDHKDQIFTSTFRDEADTKFLLKELEESETFWREIGLKHRVNGQFEPADYILCLKKIRERLESSKNHAPNAGLIKDALAVLSPLTTPSTALGRLSRPDWSAVADHATFPTITSFNTQSSHRRTAMEIVAIAMPTMLLSEVIGSQYMSICWSQIPFPIESPTVATLDKLASKGKPSTLMVWNHLQHMASSIMELHEDAVAAFVSDLYSTYDYLQDNLEDSIASFSKFQESRLWFNFDLADKSMVRKVHLEPNKCSIKNLILETSCDTANLQSVRQGLIRYQKLLRALGCKSIVYPSVDAPKIHANHLISTDLRRLRREGLLLDLTLEAKSGNVRAHKVVMAASSGFFARQFKDHWSNHDNIDLKPFAHSTLSSVVDFAYADTFDWSSMQILEDEYDKVDITANKLDDFLDLLEAAQYLDMPDLKTQVENQILLVPRLFIREHNVLGVLNRASDAEAGRVVAYCNVFYADNKEAVDLAMKE
jgi:sacsin